MLPDITDIPPRCALHQCVKGQAYDVSNPYKHCYMCQYYKLNLDSKNCGQCLTSEHLINFKLDQWIEEDPNWQYYIEQLFEKEGD